MSLTDSQKTTVSTWIADGKSLADVQSLLREAFSISMTYMDVRFLVDDLNIVFEEPEPEVTEDADAKAEGFFRRLAEQCLHARRRPVRQCHNLRISHMSPLTLI